MRTSFTILRDRAVHTGRAAGFTLVELMVVVVIVTILAAVAVPAYTNSVRKSRRTEAKNALLDLAGREERYMATNGAYTDQGTQLGYPQDTWPQYTSSGYYQLQVSGIVAPVAGTATTAGTPAKFLITATASGTQAKDTQCLSFTIDQTGTQSSFTTGNAASAGCW